VTAALDRRLILAPLPARDGGEDLAPPAAMSSVSPREDAAWSPLVGGDAAWRELVAVCERAYPDEACGWIVDGEHARVGAKASPGARMREAARGGRDAFAFSDDDLLALVAAMRSPAPPCALFHSHPDGDAGMSAADRAALALHPLPHVVVALAGGRARAATMYAWRDGEHVVVARWRRT
jgi:proteasome lid subunit RPN8/RPN11